MTYHHSSEVDRGTCMYIGTHCEREDPYGFLSAHCVLDLDTNMLQWVFASCAICQVTYQRIVPIMTPSRTLSFCMGRGIWNTSQRTVRCHGVIKLPFLSFFSLFFHPIRYNKPFLCPHVTCQLSCVRLCQAHPASLQSTTGQTTVRLCQAQSSLTLDHSPSCLRHHSCHPPSRSMSPSFAISLSHSVAYATLSQDGALCLLSLLSLIVPRLLILTPRHSLAFLHSFCLHASLCNDLRRISLIFPDLL